MQTKKPQINSYGAWVQDFMLKPCKQTPTRREETCLEER